MLETRVCVNMLGGTHGRAPSCTECETLVATSPVLVLEYKTHARARSPGVCCSHNMTSDCAAIAWSSALASLPPDAPTAGLLHLQLGAAWPDYMSFVLRAAAGNAGISFYFIGPELNTSACANCHHLPLDDTSMLERIEAHLKVKRHEIQLTPRKMCDLKPMWPALFPELSSRHAWIGYSDYDILYGEGLSREVAALTDADELLVPSCFFPQPLANGNLVLMRSTSKLIRAFEHGGFWRRALQHDGYYVFDEWWGLHGPSMMDIYHQMFLDGEISARPTRLPIAQDIIVLNEQGKGTGIPIDFDFAGSASVSVIGRWRAGVLTAERRGPCICPNDTAFTPINSLTSTVLSGCTACLRQRGVVRADQTVHREVELLGLHFQDWKKRWAGQHNVHDAGACGEGDFDLLPGGFRCASPGPPPTASRLWSWRGNRAG